MKINLESVENRVKNHQYPTWNHLLALDTSSSQTSIAVWRDGHILCDTKIGQRLHAQWILPAIDALLSEAALSFSQLDAIVYGQGPGSFTGLRIGCSIAKGLAYAHDIPLIPLSNLQIIAQQAYEQCISHTEAFGVLSLINAHMGQLYWAYFEMSALKNFSDAAPVPEFIASRTTEYLSDPSQIRLPNEELLILGGLDFEAYISQLPSLIQKKTVAKVPLLPSAAMMLKIATKSNTPVDAKSASLVYLNNPFA